MSLCSSLEISSDYYSRSSLDLTFDPTQLDFTLGNERETVPAKVKADCRSRQVEQAVACTVAAMLDLSSCSMAQSETSSSSGYISASSSDVSSSRMSVYSQSRSLIRPEPLGAPASPKQSEPQLQRALGPRPQCIGAESPASPQSCKDSTSLDSSDTSSFMSRPLCGAPVTRHQVAPSTQRRLVSKLRKFGRQLRRVDRKSCLAVL